MRPRLLGLTAPLGARAVSRIASAPLATMPAGRAGGRANLRSSAPRFAVIAALALSCLLVLASPASALEQRLSVAGDDGLGLAVAVDGDTLVLGADADANGTGAVYVFQRAGDAWTRTAKLTASDGAAGDLLGASVAINGDRIVAGAPDDNVANADQGSVYIFARTGAPARTETAKLTASDGAAAAQSAARSRGP
jgi:hypothetical protein